jgi:hypothetical protein
MEEKIDLNEVANKCVDTDFIDELNKKHNNRISLVNHILVHNEDRVLTDMSTVHNGGYFSGIYFTLLAARVKIIQAIENNLLKPVMAERLKHHQSDLNKMIDWLNKNENELGKIS